MSDIQVNYKPIFEGVFESLRKSIPKEWKYHNVAHTKQVIAHANFLANQEKIQEKDKSIILLAALYHDLGYTIAIKNHEEIGCQIARSQLENIGLNQVDIQAICGMIMATKIPQSPKNLWEKIIADADLFYLGTSSYPEQSENLYAELSQHNPDFNRAKWKTVQLDFLAKHRFHTDYAQQNLEAVKQANIEWVRKSGDLP